jgi:hypothetical protein
MRNFHAKSHQPPGVRNVQKVSAPIAKMNKPRHTYGIFGQSESGKTTLAQALSIGFWERLQIKTLVLVVQEHELPSWAKLRHATTYLSEKQFWRAVWDQTGKVVIIEDAVLSVDRKKDLRPVFTTLRHNEHRTIVVGHHGSELLPLMRQNIQELYLFRQPDDVAKDWAHDMVDEGLREASTLDQYEYLHCVRWKGTTRERLDESEIVRALR